MMKKILALVLLLSLLMSSALAEGDFDFNLFRSNGNYTVEVDEFNGTCYIDCKDRKGQTFGIDGGATVQFTPEISRAANSTGMPIMTLYTFLYDDAWLFYDTIYIKIDDTTYTCENTTVTIRQVMNGGIVECVMVGLFGTQMYKMMDDWAACEGDIRVRFAGSKGNRDFTMGKQAQQAVADMYKLYLEAGGSQSRDVYLAFE